MSDKAAPSRLDHRIVACRRCPRLRAHCAQVARTKRASYRDWAYHGKPVPNFWPGPSGAREPARARLLVVGLAPAAHGANRTGRMFTGDRSGDFLYDAMHRAGLATQARCTHPGDGLELRDTVITAACHCAPPANKPTRQELDQCAPWLAQTFDVLKELRVVLCLGRIAFESVMRLYKDRGWVRTISQYPFGHGAELFVEKPGGAQRSGPKGTSPNIPAVLCSFHPSQQNTFTGRLTMDMLERVFLRARELMES